MSEQDRKLHKTRPSAQQMEKLVTFMEKNKLFATNDVDEIISSALWKNLTDDLNAISGPVRQMRLWKKTWNDLQRSLDQRINLLKKGDRTTPLNDIDVRVIKLLEKTSGDSQKESIRTSRSPQLSDRSESHRPRKKSRSPQLHERSRSPWSRQRSESPASRKKAQTRYQRKRSQSPHLSERSQSSRLHKRFESPESRKKVQSPHPRKRSWSPPFQSDDQEPIAGGSQYKINDDGLSRQMRKATKPPTIDLTSESAEKNSVGEQRRSQPTAQKSTGANTSAVINAMNEQTVLIEKLVEKLIGTFDTQNKILKEGFNLVADRLEAPVKDDVPESGPAKNDSNNLKPETKFALVDETDYVIPDAGDNETDGELQYEDVLYYE